MAHRDDNDLAWRGYTPPPRPGGFVSGVGLNRPPAPLAVDPDGVVPARRRSPAAGAGLGVTVDRLDDGEQGRVQPNGRVRIPR